MCLERHARRVFLAPVVVIIVAAVVVAEQRPNRAIVVDLDGLLRYWRMVAERGGLQDEAIDGSKDKQLPDQIRHLCSSALCVSKAWARGRRKEACKG
jgi:hypothetical protein